MKIVSITMLKNEEDIVESFIRYNLNILDEMIILDNFSTDNTLNILKSLKREGLPIHIIKDEDESFNQDIKLTKILYQAFDDFNADIVCVLDADEFITSDNSNPRKILESIDCNKYYQVKWDTYVPTIYDDYSKDFIPSRFKYVRDEKVETLYKVIVPKGVIKNRNFSIAMGNHDLLNCDIPPDRSLNLKLAHFPLRSKEQAMSKILVNWPNMIFKYMGNNQYGVHWKLFFNKIKETGGISCEDLENFGKNYSLASFQDDIEIYEKKMNIDFCKNLEIKYTYHYNYLRNVLENYLKYVDENIFLKEEINSLSHHGETDVAANDEFTALDILQENYLSAARDICNNNFFSLDSSIEGRNVYYPISVIVPVHNGEANLRECLDSLVNQTLGIENIEVILVDDFSQDKSIEIIKEYSSNYPSIKLIRHTTNLGCGPSRNTGLKYANGEYITFMDCDDYISLNAYERALEIFEKDDEIDLVIYKWEEVNENGLLNRSDIAKTLLKEEKTITDINDFPEIIFATFAYIKVYSRRMSEFLEFAPSNFQDVIPSAKVMMNSKKMFVADDVTVFYRQHQGQVSTEMSARKYLTLISVTKEVIDLRDSSSEEYFDILSFLALKLVYHSIWYIMYSKDFLLGEGEIIYPALKEFPKYFSKDILLKYQTLFPSYFSCGEQPFWDLEKMDFWEYVYKNRFYKDIKRLENENFNLKSENGSLKSENYKLNKTIKSKNKKIKAKDKNLREILNSRSWKLTAPLRKLKNFFK